MPLFSLGINAGWVNLGNPNTIQLQSGDAEIRESAGQPVGNYGFVLLQNETYVVDYTNGGTLWARCAVSANNNRLAVIVTDA